MGPEYAFHTFDQIARLTSQRAGGKERVEMGTFYQGAYTDQSELCTDEDVMLDSVISVIEPLTRNHGEDSALSPTRNRKDDSVVSFARETSLVAPPREEDMFQIPCARPIPRDLAVHSLSLPARETVCPLETCV